MTTAPPHSVAVTEAASHVAGADLLWLINWYISQCEPEDVEDGGWQEWYGVKIDTLDNPGWSLTVDVVGTKLEDRPFEPVHHNLTVAEAEGGLWGHSDWWVATVEEKQFRAYGGPKNLVDLIRLFRSWATQSGSEHPDQQEAN